MVETDRPVGIVDVDGPLGIVPLYLPNPDHGLGVEFVTGVIAFADQDHLVSLAGGTDLSFLDDHQPTIAGDIQSSSLENVAHDVTRFSVLDEEEVLIRDIHHLGEY